MRRSQQKSTSLLLLLLVWPLTVWGAITAEVDKTRLGPGETVELRIRLEGDRTAQPDLSPLETHFDILSRSQSAQTRIINWKRESFREWTLVLAPKRTGIVVIPPIQAGQSSTQPISLQVAAGDAGGSGPSAPVYLEAVVEPKRAHVQSQLLLSVRVVHRYELEGNLTEPEVPGAVVEKLGDQRTYSEVRNGIRYRITERRYAIFPQRSGDLEIPPLVLTGTLHPQPQRFGFNPFGPSQGGKTIRLRSEPVRIAVLPRPNDWPAAATWLPARAVSMAARWTPENQQGRTGEPLVLQITTEAEGLAATQIPAPRIDWPAALQVYPDKAVQDSEIGANGLTGTRVDRYTVIPSQGGRYVIPEIRLPWWNTTTQRREISRVPAVQLQVEGMAAPVPESQAPDSVRPPGFAPSSQPAASATGGKALPWILCVLLGIGWAVTTWLLLRRNQPTRDGMVGPRREVPDERHWYALARACRENRAGEAYRAALGWLRELPEPAATALRRALNDASTDAALASAWRELENGLYGRGRSAAWDGLQFFQAISHARKRCLETDRQLTGEALPPLYPRKQAT